MAPFVLVSEARRKKQPEKLSLSGPCTSLTAGAGRTGTTSGSFQLPRQLELFFGLIRDKMEALLLMPSRRIQGVDYEKFIPPAGVVCQNGDSLIFRPAYWAQIRPATPVPGILGIARTTKTPSFSLPEEMAFFFCCFRLCKWVREIFQRIDSSCAIPSNSLINGWP